MYEKWNKQWEEERPEKRTEADIIKLLKGCSMKSSTPDDVSKAAFSFLCKRNIFTVLESGHIELTNHPGVTLLFPDEATQRIQEILMEYNLFSQEVQFVLGFIFTWPIFSTYPNP